MHRLHLTDAPVHVSIDGASKRSPLTACKSASPLTMKPTPLLSALVLLTATTLAQVEDKAFLEQFEKTFEQGGSVQARDFVPEAQMSGTLHTIRPMADNDGLNNTYFIDSPSGMQEVTGTAALEARIREIYALDYLRGLSKTEEFGKALGKSVESKVKSVGGIVRDPVGTIKNVPKGASRFFGRIGEGMKGGKSVEEGGSPLAGITGVSKAKTQLAAKLGVSPYTTNEELQRELTSTAQAMAGGGLLVSAATSLASGGAGAALSVVGVNQTLQDTLVNSSPEDLRILNRKKLFALGVSREQADEFLMHPWYSPWHETIVTDALATIGVNPRAYLAQACEALTPEDAFYFQRLAQILARYHTTKTPLRSLRVENGVVCALDREGTLVVPLSCDFAIWAERAARRSEEFAASARSNPDLKGLALWVDGKVSPRLAEELAARKIAVKTDALGNR